MTRAEVGPQGTSVNGAAPGWGICAGEPDPLAAAARALVGARNARLSRLDRPTLAALVATHVVLAAHGAGAAPRPGVLAVSVADGSATADRAYWRTARERDGTEASPVLFAATLLSAVAGELAITFGLTCPCVVLAGSGVSDADLEAVSGVLSPERARRSPHEHPAAGAAGRLVVRLRGWGGTGDGFAAANWGDPDETPESGSGLEPACVGVFVQTTQSVSPTVHELLRADLVRLIETVMRTDPGDTVDPATVTDATPCLGAPLLLDSLDVLELVVSIDRVYGASLRDGDVGRSVLANMGSLTRFVTEHRTR